MKSVRWLSLIAMAMLLSSALAVGQVVDCSRAIAGLERLICSDATLRPLDTRMGSLLAQALASMSDDDAEKLRDEQRLWIEMRDDCGNYTMPRTCVLNAYTMRNNRLLGLVLNITRVAITPGQPPVVKTGTLTGKQRVTYTLTARQGDTLVVDLRSTGTPPHFRLLPLESDQAVYASQAHPSVNPAFIRIPADGDYELIIELPEATDQFQASEFALALSLE